MRLHEFVMADAVHTIIGDDQIVTDVECGGFCHTVVIFVHPFIHTVGETGVVEFACDFHTRALLGSSGDQQQIPVPTGEHVGQQRLLFGGADTHQNLTEVDKSSRGIDTDRLDVLGAFQLAELPAVGVGATGHQNLATYDTEYRLELRFVVKTTVRLLFGFEHLPEHHAGEADVAPLGEHDVLQLELFISAGDGSGHFQNRSGGGLLVVLHDGIPPKFY